ncbi:vacuolar protein sorting 33A [Moesziomyces antarcticus]|uniref:Vacuolar protein sorting 33A n=2 Tax=Pseudozyma antarctica TaxID=84753 RepID=A0A081CCT4_PSEA2|nr:vacuolar protein sorting 33A [Moesziomyces antarcticus]GAK64480.1 vacuolar protein sorting 33A [Moesziomyces antarcticus]SPO45011.1 probable vacuolar sorting protein (hbrA) [Moesziomyces antarcticus]
MAPTATAPRQAGTDAGPDATAVAPGSPQSSAGASADMAQPLTERWDGLDTNILGDLARRGLMSTLDTIKEAKTLMLDPSLAGPLGLVADVSGLKQHGVEKMFWLEPASAAFVSKTDTAHSQALSKAGLKSVNAPTKSVVYICRPEIKWMKAIAEHLRADRSVRPTSPLQHTYTISFVPHRTEPCLQFLDQEGVLSDVSLLDFGLEFVPLDHDLISLEDDAAWKKIYCDGDHTPIFRSAQALMTLQHAYGLFPRVLGKGALARRLADLLIRQRREHLASDPSNPALTTPSQLIDSLIIIDRSVDYATPLCTQLTYEGLVDEVVGISNGHVEVDPALLTGQAQPPGGGMGAQPHASGSGTPLQMTSTPKKRKHRLDASTDVLFGEIRDLNFAVVGDRLHRAAKRLNHDYEGRHQAKTVSQIRAFVGKLGGLQSEHASLRLHTGLTEKIMEWTAREEFNRMLEVQQNSVAGLELGAQYAAIEDMINEERDLLGVLRLLCLTSVVGHGSAAGGIKPKNLEFVKREIVQTYGYQHLPLLLALQKVGLLTRAAPGAADAGGGVAAGFGALTSVVGGGSSAAGGAAAGDGKDEGGRGGFASVRRSLRLINDDVDERAPSDISYVYSGYAPLSVRLVQAVAQKEALLDVGRAASTALRPGGRSVKPRAHPIVGWRGFEDVVGQLPGPTFDEVQSAAAGPGGSETSTAGAAATMPSDADQVTTTLVFFLGGVTHTELAALRFMNGQTRNRRFVVATTNTINGNELIRSLSSVPL